MTAVIPSANRYSTRVSFALLALGLILLASQARAQLVNTRTGIFQTIESEIQYFVTRQADTDWQSVLADSSVWISNSELPFVATRGAMEVWARFDLPDSQLHRTALLNTSPWERVEIYLVRDGQLVASEVAGTLVPAAERSIDIGMTSRFQHSG